MANNGDLKPVRTEPHIPYRLKNTNTMKKLIKDVTAGVEKGLSIEDACVLAGIHRDTYYRWRREAIEDWEDGFTGTNLQKFIFEVTKADKMLFARLNDHMWDKVEEGDARIMMYLADNRFGYANKRKNTVELGTTNKTGTTINIVNMTGIDNENEDNVEIEVNGNSRDDTDSTEMD